LIVVMYGGWKAEKKASASEADRILKGKNMIRDRTTAAPIAWRPLPRNGKNKRPPARRRARRAAGA
jgi:hypothetical protein